MSVLLLSGAKGVRNPQELAIIALTDEIEAAAGRAYWAGLVTFEMTTSAGAAACERS